MKIKKYLSVILALVCTVQTASFTAAAADADLSDKFIDEFTAEIYNDPEAAAHRPDFEGLTFSDKIDKTCDYVPGEIIILVKHSFSNPAGVFDENAFPEIDGIRAIDELTLATPGQAEYKRILGLKISGRVYDTIAKLDGRIEFQAVEPNYIMSGELCADTYGDANRDGKVNTSDVTRILKYLADWDVMINADMADVNADSKVNVSDAAMLLKYLAGWDVVLGE